MKKLIISWDSYTWVHCLAGTIARSPKQYEVAIVTKDDKTPIHWAPGLCFEAVYAQRTYDLYRVGKQLKIPKLYNMLLNDMDFDEDKLIAELQMKIVFGGFGEVYFQDNALLENVFKAIKKKVNIEVAVFDRFKGVPMTITLDEDELKEKRTLKNLMYALPHYHLDYDNEENLYRI